MNSRQEFPDVPVFNLLRVIPNDGDPNTVKDVKFSPDGTLFGATFTEHNRVNIYDAKTCELVRSIHGPGSLLDHPHGIFMTNRHVIITNKHAVPQRCRINVYRLNDDTNEPCHVHKAPPGYLEGHSMDMHGNVLVITFCGKYIGALVSFDFDDASGKLSGPLDVHETGQHYGDYVEPKGIAFDNSGTQLLVTLVRDKPLTVPGAIQRLVKLLRERKGLRFILKKGWYKVINSGNSLKQLYRHHSGIAYFNIDKNGRFHHDPSRTAWLSRYHRLEGIHVAGTRCVISDVIHDSVYMYDTAVSFDPENPDQTITDRLSFPHSACLSPDGRQLVVANCGLQVSGDRPQWGKFRQPRGDCLTVHAAGERATLAG